VIALISINKKSLSLLRKLIEEREKLKIEIDKEGQSLIIDAGINTKGSIKAGILISKICTGNLSKIHILKNINSINNVLKIETDEPILACLGSQYAGWRIKINDFYAMGSGPARSLSDIENDLFSSINYKDDFNSTIICLETRNIPNDKVLDYICEHTNIKRESLSVILMPTASLVGSVQISARVLETAIHQLYHKNFNVNKIKFGKGICPIAPVLSTDIDAMGITNDAIIMMGEVDLVLDNIEDYEIENKISVIPSVFSPNFGKSFMEIFKEAKYDFYKIDPALFAPAKINIFNRSSGSKFSFGYINSELFQEVLKKYQ
jgi:methenyltetrahydromethanopterin cyclohydrolase